MKKDFGDRLDKFSERDQKLFNWIYNERPWTYVKGQGDSNDWTAWTMFNLTKTSNSDGLTGKVDPRIYIPGLCKK